jgi:hypothetical protein
MSPAEDAYPRGADDRWQQRSRVLSTYTENTSRRRECAFHGCLLFQCVSCSRPRTPASSSPLSRHDVCPHHSSGLLRCPCRPCTDTSCQQPASRPQLIRSTLSTQSRIEGACNSCAQLPATGNGSHVSQTPRPEACSALTYPRQPMQPMQPTSSGLIGARH